KYQLLVAHVGPADLGQGGDSAVASADRCVRHHRCLAVGIDLGQEPLEAVWHRCVLAHPGPFRFGHQGALPPSTFSRAPVIPAPASEASSSAMAATSSTVFSRLIMESSA